MSDLKNRKEMVEAWEGFDLGNWSEGIDTRDFIQRNYKPYEGDGDFLKEPSKNTKELRDEVKQLKWI